MAKRIKKNKKAEEHSFKAKIINVRYFPETDIVSWECLLPDGRKHYLHWPRTQFGPSLGINADIPPSIIKNTLNSFLNKEFNLIIKEFEEKSNAKNINDSMKDFIKGLKDES